MKNKLSERMKLWALPKKIALKFAKSENGGVIEYVLIIGVISLPLVIFLLKFGTNVVKWIKEHAPEIFKEASTWLGS